VVDQAGDVIQKQLGPTDRAAEVDGVSGRCAMRWVQEHAAQPIELGARMTYLADATVPALETKGPDYDFALPIN
jgi:hypothetical protein